MTATVSIVIPTFNRADKLPRAIDSALDQTVPCEVIVVDHDSADQTPDVAAAYGDKITYVRRDRDFGPHFCWLDGVMHSTGDLVHLQYDDDWIEPRFVEACLAVMDDETGFAFTMARVHTEGGTVPDNLLFRKWLPRTGTFPVAKIEKRITRGVVSPGCCTFRRQTLIDGLYQGQLPLPEFHYHGVGPDRFIALLSMLRYPKVGFVREPLAVFLAHPGSITIDAGADKQKAEALNRAYRDVSRFYRELKLIKRMRKVFGVSR